MWIERLQIAGFGRLSGEFELDRGLTVVQGPNEAGKSTLHDALVRSMFGFSKTERRLKQGSSVIESRAPWQGGPFGLVALAHIAGRDVRIEWTFGPEREQKLRLLEALTSDELTAEVAEKGGSYALGEWLLGIGLEDYRQWSCLDQAAGGSVKGDPGLVERLRNASETGREEAGVDRARALITDARMSEAIGVNSAWKTPLRNRAYAFAISRRDELKGRIGEAEETQARLESDAKELERVEAEQSELRGRIARLEQERLLARRAGLAETVERVRAAHRRAEVGDVGAAPEIPVDVANEARTLQTRIEELRSERAAVEARRGAASGELSKLMSEAGVLDAEIQGLSAYETLDASQEGRIGGLLGGLLEREEAVRAVEAGVPRGPGGGADGGDPSAAAESGLEQPVGEGGDGAGSEWVVPAGIAAASVVGGLLVSPAVFAGLLVAAAVYWWLRERRQGERAERARAEALREAELARLQVEQQRVRAEWEAHEQALGDASARLESQRAELGAVLDAVRAASGEPRARAQGYLEACKQAERLAGLRAERARLAEQMRTLNEPAGRLQAIDDELEQRGAKLSRLLRSLGIAEEGADAIAELGRMERSARQAREQRLAAEEAGESLKSLLNGRSIPDVEAALREVESELAGHRSKHGTFDLTPRGEAQVASDLDAENAAIAVAAQRHGTARQRVDDLEGKLADVPAWRAELDEVEGKIERIEFAIDALRIADEELEEAAAEAHRRSVPGLNRAINGELPRLTDGRYTQATVNEKLEITLTAPEINRAVAAERLSKGTQDQIYLVQRLAILELLSEVATEPPPLLLDDAFAHFDADRRRAALQLLAEKAEERQIVLFVDEPEVAEELEAIGAEFGSIELVGPGERVEA